MNKSPKDLKKFMRSLENYMSFILGAIKDLLYISAIAFIFTITFLVRHPIERLLSAYRDRFGNILTIEIYQNICRILGRKLSKAKIARILRVLNMTKSPRLVGDKIEPVVANSGPRSPHRTNRNDLVPTWREFVQFLLRSPVEEDVT